MFFNILNHYRGIKLNKIRQISSFLKLIKCYYLYHKNKNIPSLIYVFKHCLIINFAK